MEKSYVSLEKKVCMVCGKEYDSGSLLLDRRLQDSMEKYTVTGWGVCSEDQEKLDAGYVALIGIDSAKSDDFTPEGVYRTGQLLFIKRQVLPDLGIEIEDKDYIVFADERPMNDLIRLGEQAKRRGN